MHALSDTRGSIESSNNSKCESEEAPSRTLSLSPSPICSSEVSENLTSPQTTSQLSVFKKPLSSPKLWQRCSTHATRAYNKGGKYFRKWIPPTGWRTTVMAGASLAIVTLIINIAIMAWSFTTSFDDRTNTRTLWEYDCSSKQNIFTYTHLAINACSTLLLAASNATMQCLNAPTREAINRAHTRGQWLDIGISGFRNWRHMDNWRKHCWIMLVLSTIPLHLLYNSVIFQTTTANEYYTLFVSSDFGQGDLDRPIGLSSLPQVSDFPTQENLIDFWNLAQNQSTFWEHMDNKKCIETYSQAQITEYSNVLLVTKNWTENATQSFFHHHPKAEGDLWVCGEMMDQTDLDCNIDQLAEDASSWNFTGYGQNTSDGFVNIDHCLAQRTTPKCTMQLVPEVMGIVIFCNIVKVICFILAVRMRNFQPLITLGDALASFLRQNDPTTRNLGPLSANDIRKAEERLQINLSQGFKSDEALLSSEPWRVQRRRWFSGASRSRWLFTYLLMMLAITVGLFSLRCILASIESLDPRDSNGCSRDPYYSWNYFYTSLAQQWQNGFGSISLALILPETTSNGVLINLLIANTPQLLLSAVYLSYNGLFTSILITQEFTEYANRRKGLRVSCPYGFQHSTNFLNLPYRYSIPLLALSTLSHWALSQTLFLAEIRMLQPIGILNWDDSINCLGYSSLGLLTTLGILAFMVLIPLIVCWKSYSPGAPLPEINSLAISAACQLDCACDGDLLKYGARGNRVGLGTGPVKSLTVGTWYSHYPELGVQTQSIGHLTRRFKLLLILAALVNISGFSSICFVAFAWEPTFQVPSRCGTIVTEQWLFAFVLLHLITRGAIDYNRTRKKQFFPEFVWHIVPEIIWTAALVLVFLEAKQELRPDYVGFVQVDDDDMNGIRACTVAVSLIGAQIALRFVSVVLEIWMWLDQYRYSLSSLLKMRNVRIAPLSAQAPPTRIRQLI